MKIKNRLTPADEYRILLTEIMDDIQNEMADMKKHITEWNERGLKKFNWLTFRGKVVLTEMQRVNIEVLFVGENEPTGTTIVLGRDDK